MAISEKDFYSDDSPNFSSLYTVTWIGGGTLKVRFKFGQYFCSISILVDIVINDVVHFKWNIAPLMKDCPYR